MSAKNKKPAPAAAPNPAEQTVVITATILPVKNGKRPLVISAAPDGEMPVVRTGTFSEIHRLFDEAWLEIIKRKPKVVVKPAESKTVISGGPKRKKSEPDEEAASEEAETEQETTTEESRAEAELEASVEAVKTEGQAEHPDTNEADQLVRDEAAPSEPQPELLPIIEGDATLETA